MFNNRIKFSELTLAIADMGYNVSMLEDDTSDVTGGELFASAVPFLYKLFEAENGKKEIADAALSLTEIEDYGGIIELLYKEGYTKKEAESICDFYEDFNKYSNFYLDEFYNSGFIEAVKKIVATLTGVRTSFEKRLWGGLALVALIVYDYCES